MWKGAPEHSMYKEQSSNWIPRSTLRLPCVALNRKKGLAYFTTNTASHGMSPAYYIGVDGQVLLCFVSCKTVETDALCPVKQLKLKPWYCQWHVAHRHAIDRGSLVSLEVEEPTASQLPALFICWCPVPYLIYLGMYLTKSKMQITNIRSFMFRYRRRKAVKVH